MEAPTRLVQELSALCAAYRAGAIRLPSLASRVEILVESMHAHLPGEDFARAMNFVYLIEEINAVVLDENRPLNTPEKEAIENDLSLLEKLVSH